MTVDLKLFTGDNRELHKQTTTVSSSVNCDATKPMDVVQPTFILEYPEGNFNYLYSSSLGRYYFVTEIRYLTGGRVEVDCLVDVLMSGNEDGEIDGADATIIRSGKGITYIPDDKLPIKPNEKNIREIRSSNPFPEGLNRYVLTTLKGGGSNG